MKTFTTLFVFLLCSSIAVAQNHSEGSDQKEKPAKTKKTLPRKPKINGYAGFGAGLDYGGLGSRVEYLPVKSIGIFGGVGYNLDGFGYNIGLSGKAFPDSDVRFVGAAMYGYNGVILIKDSYTENIVYKKTYYGFSIGAGGEFDLGRYRSNKLSLMIIKPFREEFNRDADEIGATYFPVAISIGINFGF